MQVERRHDNVDEHWSGYSLQVRRKAHAQSFTGLSISIRRKVSAVYLFSALW